MKTNIYSANFSNNKVIQAQKMYEKKHTFKEIAKTLNINLSDAIHYCTDLKYKLCQVKNKN